MREIEKRILREIEIIMNGKRYAEYAQNYDMAKMLMYDYCQGPFGHSTAEFLNSSILKKYLEQQEVNVWMLIESYICAKVEPTESYLDLIKNSYLDLIESTVKQIKKEIFKPSGQGLFTYVSRDLIKNIYLSNDSVLISIFMNNLPIPSSQIFDEFSVPKVLLDKEKKEKLSVATFLKNPRLEWEPMLINMQRHIRYKNRQKEEKHRIQAYRLDTPFSVNHILKDASMPYIPKSKHCSVDLRIRIMKAVEKITLFNTVRHVTAEMYIDKIFDEGLMGRRTLLQRYLPFKPAALDDCDLDYGGGDANVICFGPNEIDPKADPKFDFIEITMNVDKIKPNKCIFYKQRDLGLYRKAISQLNIKNHSFYFTHTRELKGRSNVGYTNLQFSKGLDSFNDEDCIAYSLLPNYFFTGYSQDKMHQILTLNFFRYIDTLYNFTNNKPDDSIAKEIYDALDTLSETELITCLQSIGCQMTCTAEFNFYGMYKIDFSAVKSIENEFFHLDVVDFISLLQAGDIDELEQTQQAMPNVFKSYRFLDYLLSVPESKDYPQVIQDELNIMRSLCLGPTSLAPTYEVRRYQEETKISRPF